MTQKSNQFKGQQKKKTVAPNRHGKAIQTRKGILTLISRDFLFLRLSLSSCVCSYRKEIHETVKDDERVRHRPGIFSLFLLPSPLILSRTVIIFLIKFGFVNVGAGAYEIHKPLQ